MAVTPNELIQLLQLIILAVTAAIFICQFALRLFQDNQAIDLVQSVGEEEVVHKLQHGTKSFFISVFFLAINGSFISFYLVLYTVPGEVGHFLDTFYAYRYYTGLFVVLALIGIAIVISGDLENQHTGIVGFAVSSVSIGLISIVLLVFYFVLLAASRSIEWIFFISGISLAIALSWLLFGFFFILEGIMDIVDKL